jgi:hypothetical protein
MDECGGFSVLKWVCLVVRVEPLWYDGLSVNDMVLFKKEAGGGEARLLRMAPLRHSLRAPAPASPPDDDLASTLSAPLDTNKGKYM